VRAPAQHSWGTCSLSGGRRPARKRSSSDPTKSGTSQIGENFIQEPLAERNGAERWVGSCRRDLLDHVIALNEHHLRRLLSEYVRYYHKDRTHLGLNKETPVNRPTAIRTGDCRVILKTTPGRIASPLRPRCVTLACPTLLDMRERGTSYLKVGFAPFQSETFVDERCLTIWRPIPVREAICDQPNCPHFWQRSEF